MSDHALSCPSCDGSGEVFAFQNRGEDISAHSQGMVRCPTCSGTGLVDANYPHRVATGVAYRNLRLSRQETLHGCATRIGVSSAQLSSFECGRALPDNIMVLILGIN